MPDAIRVLPPGLRILSATGAVVAGGSLEFYQAAGSTPRTVYSDSSLITSLGTVVYLDSGGYTVASLGSSTKVLIYTGVNAYKIICKDSSGATLWTHDNIIGALDTSGFSAATALPTSPVISTASPITLGTSHRGKVVNVDCSGGAVTITLDADTTLGDNWRGCIRHVGTAGQVRIVTTGGDLISFPSDVTTTAFSLVGRGESVWISCSGAGFNVDSYAPPLMRPNGMGSIKITDRVSAEPGSPTAGARYIVTAAFSTFEQEDVIEANGQGGWIEYTPTEDCGWVAYVADENIYYYFRGTAWVAETATETQQGTLELATAAETKAGTSTTTAVTPANLQPQSWIRVTKAADETVTASTTFQDDDALTFAVAANTKYSWRCTIFMTTPAAADWKYQFTGPAAPTAVKYGHIAAEDGAGGEFGVATAFSTSIVVSAVATLWIIELRGRLSNGANAGNVTLQWAQNTSDAGNTIVELGSYLEYIVVP